MSLTHIAPRTVVLLGLPTLQVVHEAAAEWDTRSYHVVSKLRVDVSKGADSSIAEGEIDDFVVRHGFVDRYSRDETR